MSEGCEAKPWPLPPNTALEESNDATKTHSSALKENIKVEINSPSKAVAGSTIFAKKPTENRAMSINEKGANPNGSGSQESGKINRVDPSPSINAVPNSKCTEDGSITASKASNLNSDVAVPASGKELKRGGDQLPENSVLQASARPIVIPIQKVFAPVHEAGQGVNVSAALQVNPSDAPTEQSIDDSLQCPSCLSNYTITGQKTPKLLPCLHTFCFECIQGFGRRQCTLCRKSFLSTEELADNFLAMETLESFAVKEGHARACEECEDGIATHRCDNCCRYMCTPCQTQHTRAKATKSHTIQTMEELRNAPWKVGTQSAELCSVPGHSEQRINMYCFTCSKLVCMQCVVLEHPKPAHDYNLIEQAFITEAATLNSLIEGVEKQEKVLESVQKEIQGTINELKDNSELASASVKSVFDNLKNLLIKRQDALLQEIQAAYQRKSDVLNAQVESMRAASEQMRGAHTFVDYALRSGSKSQVLKLKDTMANALSEAQVASRSLLVIKENPVLTFDAGGSHEIEASIKSLGSIEVGRKPPPPPIMSSANGSHPQSWAQGAQLFRPPAHAVRQEDGQVVWAVQNMAGEVQGHFATRGVLSAPQPRRYAADSLPAGAAFAPVQYPDPPVSFGGLPPAAAGQPFATGVRHSTSFDPHQLGSIFAVQGGPEQEVRWLQPPGQQAAPRVAPAMWGGAGVGQINKYSTLD